jgi:HlyD family secretion protein
MCRCPIIPVFFRCGAVVLAVASSIVLTAPKYSEAQSVEKPKESKSDKPIAGDAAKPNAPTPTAEPSRTLTLPGMLQADASVDLYAKASGFVAKVNVDIGARVKKSDVLAELGIPEMTDELHHAEATLTAKRARVEALKAKAVQAQLAIDSARAESRRATAERDLSKLTFQRKTDLHTEKAIPDQELDEATSRLAMSEAQVSIANARIASAEGDLGAAQADVAAAEADVKVAEADVARLKTLIGYTSVTAPFDGVITARRVDPGAFVRSAAQGATMSLFTVEKIDRLRLVVDVPEAEAAMVRVGATLEAQVQQAKASPLNLSIARTADSIRSDTRTMRVEADLDNTDGSLLPGMYAKVTIHLASSLPGGGT